MFKKKKCGKCGKKIEGKYDFCPYCGNRISGEGETEDWGMLGKNDFMPLNNIKLPIGLNTLFNSLMKNLSKEMNKEMMNNQFKEIEEPKKMKKDGISISISTFGNGPPKIKVTQMGNNQERKIIPEKENKTKKFSQNIFTEKQIRNFSDLPKEEPKTNIRRLSNKVVYEIKMPGVKSKEDISIVQLENSIEIKAIAKSKAYAKIIPINLPIKKFNLSDGKLILELGTTN